MNWRHVFDSAKGIGIWKDRSSAALYAFKGGYKFLAWNGDVLFLEDLHEIVGGELKTKVVCRDTRVVVDDLT